MNSSFYSRTITAFNDIHKQFFKKFKIKNEDKNSNRVSIKTDFKKVAYENNVQKDNGFLEGLPKIRFFDPDFHESNVVQEPKAQFDLSKYSFFIIKEKFGNLNINTLNLELQVSWVQDFFSFIERSIEITTKNEDDLISKLPKVTSYGNIQIVKSDVSVQNSRWYLDQDFNLFKETELTYNLAFSCFYQIFRKESLFIKISKNNPEGKSLNKKISLKLPQTSSFKIWKSKNYFFENDIVIYSNQYYKCINANYDDVFDLSNWKLFSFENDSDIFCSSLSSFFLSDLNSNSLDLMKNSLKFYFEKILGQVVELLIISKDKVEISLNDYFLYNDKKYRIIKIEEIFDQIKSLKITGVEIFDNLSFQNLNLKDEAEKLLDDLNVEESLVELKSDDDSEFSLKIIVPKNIEKRNFLKIDRSI